MLTMKALYSFSGAIYQISHPMGHLRNKLPAKFPSIQYTVYLIILNSSTSSQKHTYSICNIYVICGHSGDIRELGVWCSSCPSKTMQWTQCQGGLVTDVTLSLPCMDIQLYLIHVWSLFCEHSLIVRCMRHCSNVRGSTWAPVMNGITSP